MPDGYRPAHGCRASDPALAPERQSWAIGTHTDLTVVRIGVRLHGWLSDWQKVRHAARGQPDMCKDSTMAGPSWRGHKRLSRGASRRIGWIVTCACCLLTASCMRLWDDLTASGEARKAYLFPGDPLEVLAKSQDGDVRARAYRRLREPRTHGGSEEEQHKMLHLLAVAARSEKQTLCRLAAVEKLGEFQDPRAVQGLLDAFYAPSNFGDTNPAVRVAVIEALARHRSAEALETLTQAALRDPSRHVRAAAIQALAAYGDPPALQALLTVLRQEKDVALRDAAANALAAATGQSFGTDADKWEAYLTTNQPTQPVKPAGTRWWPFR